MWPGLWRRLRPLQAVPLGPRTYMLHLHGGRRLVAKRGEIWEGVILRAVERLGLSPRLLAPPTGSGPVLLLMEAVAGAPPDWSEARALSGVISTLAELHRRTARPDGTVLCHGDLHQENALWNGQQAVLVDWGLAKRGAPLTDLARIWPWGGEHPESSLYASEGAVGSALPAGEGTLSPEYAHPTGQGALSPGCALPTGEAAQTALALYHRAGPLAQLSWTEFQAQHRAAARSLLLAERERHQRAAQQAPPGLRPWILAQLTGTEGALRQIDS